MQVFDNKTILFDNDRKQTICGLRSHPVIFRVARLKRAFLHRLFNAIRRPGMESDG